jgi:hypothetical protein
MPVKMGELEKEAKRNWSSNGNMTEGSMPEGTKAVDLATLIAERER